MFDNDPHKDWIDNEEKPKIDERERYGLRPPKKRKERLSSKLRHKGNNFKYKFLRRTHRRVRFSIGFLLGLFVPLCVALFILYLLEPGISYLPQFYGTGNTIQLILLFLILPVEVQSIVPWIAWIASGFVGGLLSRRILIPFISMYLLIWLILFTFQGNLINQQLSMFGAYGLQQIIIQELVINIIFSILAFGFGGWIGLSIGRR